MRTQNIKQIVMARKLVADLSKTKITEELKLHYELGYKWYNVVLT